MIPWKSSSTILGTTQVKELPELGSSKDNSGHPKTTRGDRDEMAGHHRQSAVDHLKMTRTDDQSDPRWSTFQGLLGASGPQVLKTSNFILDAKD